MSELSLILTASDCTAAANGIRHMPKEAFDAMRSPRALRRAAGLLRAAAYSATVAAIRCERRARELDLTQTDAERIGESTRGDRGRP